MRLLLVQGMAEFVSSALRRKIEEPLKLYLERLGDNHKGEVFLKGKKRY